MSPCCSPARGTFRSFGRHHSARSEPASPAVIPGGRPTCAGGGAGLAAGSGPTGTAGLRTPAIDSAAGATAGTRAGPGVGPVPLGEVVEADGDWPRARPHAAADEQGFLAAIPGSLCTAAPEPAPDRRGLAAHAGQRRAARSGEVEAAGPDSLRTIEVQVRVLHAQGKSDACGQHAGPHRGEGRAGTAQPRD